MNPLPPISIPDLDQRVIRITTRNVADVLAVTNGSTVHQYYPTGQVQVDVPWTFTNMQALTSIGEPALSTVFDGYDFPGKNKPFRHQLKIIDLLTRAPRGYCFAGMGTGKTRAALWAADYLMQRGAVKKALIVCPKTLMYAAWTADIFSTCIHRQYTVLYGDRKQREKLALTRDTDFDIVNFDGVEILKDILAAKNYDLVIIDESTAYKDPSTKRWKALASLVKPTTRLWALTGTPTPQGPMDAFGQGKLVTPERMPRTKTAFQSMVQTKIDRFIWKNKKGWQATVNEMLQPAVFIKKSDCLDLPPITRSFRDVGLSKPQEQAVKALKSEMLANFDSGHKVTVANAAVLHGKLRQIYSGAVYSEDGTALVLDNAARIAETLDLIEKARQSGDDEAANGAPHSKAIVFVPFKHVMAVLETALSEHYNVAVISGDTSVHERTRIIKQFQTTDSPQVILAIPEAFSHGVTATAASITIWYAPPSRTETYLQACERMDRPGQTQHMNVVHLYGDKHEYAMYQNLINNQTNQETLLQLYRGVLEI